MMTIRFVSRPLRPVAVLAGITWLVALGLAEGAQASTVDHFVLNNGQWSTFTFDLAASPSPASVVGKYFFLDNVAVTDQNNHTFTEQVGFGTAGAGDSFIIAGTIDDYGSGISTSTPVGEAAGFYDYKVNRKIAALFTGTVSNPTFSVGTFSLASFPPGSQGSIQITQGSDPAVAAVPESSAAVLEGCAVGLLLLVRYRRREPKKMRRLP